MTLVWGERSEELIGRTGKGDLPSENNRQGTGASAGPAHGAAESVSLESLRKGGDPLRLGACPRSQARLPVPALLVSLPPQRGEEAERSGPLLASRRTSYDAQQLSCQLGRHT